MENIEIGGYAGNENLWFSGNGAGAIIFTSIDKISWKEVGVIPSNFGNKNIRVNLQTSQSTWIQFRSKTYLGLGYFRILSKSKPNNVNDVVPKPLSKSVKIISDKREDIKVKDQSIKLGVNSIKLQTLSVSSLYKENNVIVCNKDNIDLGDTTLTKGKFLCKF